ILTAFKVLGLCCLVVFIFICIAYRNVNSDLSTAIGRVVAHVDRVFNMSNYQTKSSTTNGSLPLYFVESRQCKIPYIDPFAADVMKIYRPQVFETCSNDSDLVRPIYDVNSKLYVLHINSSAMSTMLNSSESQYKCFYQEITRNDKNEVPHPYKVTSPVYFQDGFKVPPYVKALILKCHKSGDVRHILQTDAYALVQDMPSAGSEDPPEPPQSKVKPLEPVLAGRRKPSVIMFGIDTMSRISLRRTMPNTYKFLSQPGWLEMQGYNKVADNTFPNLLAVLSGYSTSNATRTVCHTNAKGCLDKFPFIWKYLKRAGYLTAYAEDAPFINTFTLNKPGFQRPPTDYYHLLYMQAFDHFLQGWKCKTCTMDYCYGRRLQSSYVFDFMREYAKRYVGQRPIWGLFWSSSFSHDDLAMPSKMDNYILQYFKDFEADGVLSQNIVIFFSDHGARFGEFRNLKSGFLESRLPMLFIYLPPWFRAQYPEYVLALEQNRNRLTSNYDLHNTLKHIIEIGASPKAASLPRSASCDKCQSLFYPIKKDRSCLDAGIPDHFCTCEPYKAINYEWTERIAELVVERINDYLWAKDLGDVCANLTLKYVENVEIKIELGMEFHSDKDKAEKAQYHTQFIVDEHGASFFATVVYDSKLDVVEVDVETISRLNSYNTDSYCTQDKMAQLFCICQIQLENL
ncbi:hypothetical protein KR093_002948, partial [Drosophila rubida]